MANKGELLDDPGRYRRLVGKLNYVTVTRPDISFSVSAVSQFLDVMRTCHWDAIVHILRYVKDASSRGLLYQNHGHTKIGVT